MRWLRRILISVFVLMIALAGASYYTAQRSEHRVGFQVVRANDANGKPFAVGVWYPTTARTWPTGLIGGMVVARNAAVVGDALPLVVISHGNGGGAASHVDLAMALASAGYVVAAPNHLGDTFGDESGVGSVNLFGDRARQLRETVDRMLAPWPGRAHVDTARIGAFGFSAGGLTVLVAVGAQPDLRRVATHCATSREFACDVLQHAGSPLITASAPLTADAFVADPRIKAAVVAAPGLGFTLDSTRLAGVQVPMQLWSGDLDDKVPYATNTKVVRDALGSRVEFHAVPGAGHLSFLTPCSVLAPRAVCTDPGTFDRKAFHARMDSSVVEFFGRTLRGQRTPPLAAGGMFDE
jgi:predicted dienelactone hydrolase